MLAHDDEQLAVARERAARRAERAGLRELVTRIERLDRAWPAEDYHQKYYLRNDHILTRDFHAMFDGDETALRESTAAARVNGYIAGAGNRTQLTREIDFLGLSETGRSHLIDRVGDGTAAGSCAI